MPDPRLENAIHRIDAVLKRLTLTSVFRTRKTYSAHGYAYATFHRRLIAMTLDAFLVMLALMPFNDAINAYAFRHYFLDPALVQHAMDTAATQAELNRQLFQLQIQAGFAEAFATQLYIQFIVFATYSTLFWWFYSATPGKLLLGMRVVDEKTGERMGIFHMLFRVFGYIFAALPLGAGYAMMGLNRKRRGLHDVFAGTSVIVFTDKHTTPNSAQTVLPP